MRNVIDILTERGFIEAMTSDELRAMANKPLTVYCGFDPTGDSLHVGHLVPIIGLAWFQKCGHTPVAIVGGATGMIGDPSGKNSERNLLDEATIKINVKGIQKNLEAILDFNHPTHKPLLLNNFDWFKNFSFIDFLRDVGKNFRLGIMLAKDSVKSRLNSEDGMSFTEFSYQLLQSYDFLYLWKNHKVNVQLGGSDQWGNITAGIDLIRKVEGQQAYGLTFPLLKRSDGQKFGKSEKGAIWLSSEKLSPYEFYQYFYRVSDADVINMMRLLTFMEMSDISAYAEQMAAPGYVANTAQKRLAEEVTRIVHGEDALQQALRVTQAAAPGAETKLDGATLEALSNEIPCHTIPQTDFEGAKLLDLIVKLGIQPSKGEVKRLVKNGGLYLNNEGIKDENYTLQPSDLIDHKLALLGIGKKNKVLIKISKP